MMMVSLTSSVSDSTAVIGKGLPRARTSPVMLLFDIPQVLEVLSCSRQLHACERRNPERPTCTMRTQVTKGP